MLEEVLNLAFLKVQRVDSILEENLLDIFSDIFVVVVVIFIFVIYIIYFKYFMICFKIIFKVQGEVDSILGEKLLRRY